MIRTELKIRSNTPIADSTYEMIFDAPAGLTGNFRPGQFINIRLEGFFLRRPISLCDWTDNTISIIYKTVGKGTEEMSRLEAGAAPEVLLPLGNGYCCDSEEIGERPLLAGGGAGVPPMYALCRELIAGGARPTVLLGFRTAGEVFYVNRFEEMEADLIVTTEDGSRGEKGFVTDVMGELDYSSVFACGPEGMLKAVDEAADRDCPGWFSFEERMGCGFGACMGCSCRTKYGDKRICREGPVLSRREIIW